jgi:hypothetical protein
VTTVDPTTLDTAAGPAPWQDTTRAVQDRVEELLARMTLEEKLAQLGSRWVGNDLPDAGTHEGPAGDRDAALNVAPMQDAFAARRIVEPGDLDVLVGTSAVDLPCHGRVRLTGPLREMGHDRRLVTPVELRPSAGSADAE